ncbi:MAG: hypothetical protein KKA65_02545 [Nanoarchaeota archaeon]|nr:hypothetical protein [Nanoarchaeota archaeon]MBU4352740.1 hypothetical protein [Nanoarchaeota archaeon]MBU4456356.1 hypothetical protein [Nanoarchaeota archaeon]MCG2719277.1 hypothetical protein [Nanoarchaeota archaeon]
MKNEIIDWGYDKFIGREIFETGEEGFTSLNLRTPGAICFRSMNMACEQLCKAIKEKKKVLLNFSPGQQSPKTKNSLDTLKLLKTSLSDVLNKEENMVAEIESKGKDKTYTISGRKYEPFKPEQMKILKDLYEKRIDMKSYPNPFEHQPFLN